MYLYDLYCFFFSSLFSLSFIIGFLNSFSFWFALLFCSFENVSLIFFINVFSSFPLFNEFIFAIKSELSSSIISKSLSSLELFSSILNVLLSFI